MGVRVVARADPAPALSKCAVVMGRVGGQTSCEPSQYVCKESEGFVGRADEETNHMKVDELVEMMMHTKCLLLV